MMEQVNWVYVDWDQHLSEVVHPPSQSRGEVDWFVVWSWFGVGLFLGAFWLTVAFVIWGKR